MSATSVLQAVNLAKDYYGRYVVKNVSFRVNSGEVVGLLGPNGAGKTTSFYMSAGLILPTRGHILLNGRDISHLPLQARARLGIGYLPQEPSIFRKLSVADNIMAILEYRRDLSKRQRQQRLEALLEEFQITALRNTLGISLSGGERRRVEIIRALVMEPQFMLLDEPFAGIDPIAVGDFKSLICSLSARNIGVLVTDHNVRETLAICCRAYIVSAGEVIYEGTPAQISHHPQVRQVYLGKEFAL